MFCKQFLAYTVHIDRCNNAIHKHSCRSQHNYICNNYMHLYDDIGDASSSLLGSTSSLCLVHSNLCTKKNVCSLKTFLFQTSDIIFSCTNLNELSINFQSYSETRQINAFEGKLCTCHTPTNALQEALLNFNGLSVVCRGQHRCGGNPHSPVSPAQGGDGPCEDPDGGPAGVHHTAPPQQDGRLEENNHCPRQGPHQRSRLLPV